MQRHRVTSLETARSLANGPIVAGGWGGIPRELQRLLSLIGYGSTGGVCGRNLTAGKILSNRRQTCSLYLVLWLCDKRSSHFRKESHLHSGWRSVVNLKTVPFSPVAWFVKHPKNAVFVHHEFLNFLYFQFCSIFKSQRNSKKWLKHYAHLYLVRSPVSMLPSYFNLNCFCK